MSNNKQCQFEASRQTSSATICKWCGREKWQHNTTMSNKQSSIDWLKNEIDNELKVIDNLYGKEIMGRKIGLAFVKRILEQAKEMHKQEIVDAYRFGISDEYVIGSEKYYNETFGK